MRRLLLWSLVLGLVGCGGEPTPDAGFDAGPSEDGGSDAGFDGGRPDAGFDAGPSDAGFDAGPSDAGSDAGPFDAGPVMSVLFPPRDFRCTTGAPEPCPTTLPLRTDAERTIDVTPEMAPGTYTFAIRTWSAPEPSFAGTAAGFNLDGLDSGGGSVAVDADCEEVSQDFTSVRDPGHEGIDNAFASLIPTVELLLDASTCPMMMSEGCLDATLAARIADGSFLILVELTDVDGFTYDDDVGVALYAGAVPGGGAPMLAADGRLAPGQTFDTAGTLVATTRGDIFEGRLRVAFGPSLTLPMGADLLVPSRLDGAELRATVDATGLALGVVGGTTEVDLLVAQAVAIMPDIEPTVRSVLEAVADVEPTADPAICARVSSGYFFDAVSASRR
ncbi:MAG: hypothetical protein KC619_00815 [Myxococcales bacterium]|nr:hypothetical protein [Myxococcales bacterium]